MSDNKFGSQNWRPIVVRDNFLFVRGNPAGFETEGGETGINAIAGFNNNPGSFPNVPAVIGVAHAFSAPAQVGNIRTIDSEVLFNCQGTTTITSGQSIAAIRGAVAVALGTTIAAQGFLYGVQGKAIVQGTIVGGSAFITALFGQLDTSGASAVVTSGYVSALHLDMGATSILASSAFVNAQTVTNTTQCLINSVLKVIANATYFMDLSESNLTGNWIVGTTGSTAAGTLKVLVNGAVRYIQLFSSVA